MPAGHRVGTEIASNGPKNCLACLSYRSKGIPRAGAKGARRETISYLFDQIQNSELIPSKRESVSPEFRNQRCAVSYRGTCSPMYTSKPYTLRQRQSPPQRAVWINNY